MVVQIVEEQLVQVEIENWNQLIQQCLETHLRYATDDWIGNAIWDQMLLVLKKWSRTASNSSKNSAIPSTPLHKKTPKADSPSSTATAETVITTSYSWSSADEEEEYEEDEV